MSSKNLNFDKAFESNLRLGIISALVNVESLSFSELKEITGASDGNISVQAKKLESINYIELSKHFIKNKPKTIYKITHEGRNAFFNYFEQLRKIAQN